MKLASLLTVLIGIVLLVAVTGCSSATSVAETATPHVEATIAATLVLERAKVEPTRNKPIPGARSATVATSQATKTPKTYENILKT